ncbi:MAG: phosphatase PAP2 family protein [Chloroflexi bacterium]|nr:phosphatase PAP2 family protein [Chloroflexota bacterium]
MSKTWQVVATLLLFFVLLTITTHLRLWQSFDWEMLVALQAALPRLVDAPFSVFTLLGSAEFTGVLFFVLVLCAPTKQRLPLILAFGLATFIELVGKTFIAQPTTPHHLVRYVSFLKLVMSEKVNTQFSYPSGHALRTTFIVIVLANMIAASRLQRNVKLWLYAALSVFEFLMLVSRVYSAEHWATDVIGGGMLGAAFALSALQVSIPLPKFLSRKPL